MALPTGTTLGTRQKELNEKVNEAFKNKKPLADIVSNDEDDVNKIYLIDLASCYKDEEYVLNTLKSGDAFAITRVIKKCTWLYEKSSDKIINVQYLEKNIFPHMSIKMKKTFLTKISLHLKDQLRVLEFLNYCQRVKLNNIASKFLLKTTANHKIEAVNTQNSAYFLIKDKEEGYLKNFIGESFELAECCLKSLFNVNQKHSLLSVLRDLYSVSEEKYLDLLQEYYGHDEWKICDSNQLGLRISKDIMKNHKKRVLDYPWVYINVLHPDVVVKCSSVDDAKIYAHGTFPSTEDKFWNYNYYETYKFILDLIPMGERFIFIKNMFKDRFGTDDFECNPHFYDRQFYNMMTDQQKEDWALKQISSGKEILGFGNDFMWYQFVNFDKALPEIKKIVYLTTDSYKRSDVVKTLVQVAKNQNQLEILLKYYVGRHMNESENDKVYFITELLNHHNLLKLNESCWNELNKLFHSIGVYCQQNQANSDFKAMALVYHIIKDKKVPDVLHEFLYKGVMSCYQLKNVVSDSNSEYEERVYSYIMNNCTDKIKNMDKNQNNVYELNTYLSFVADFMSVFNKTKDEVSDIVLKHMKLNWEEYQQKKLFREGETPKYTEGDIIRALKKDAKLVIDNFYQVKEYFERRYGHVNWLLRKLKTYFSKDIPLMYVRNFELILNDVNLVPTTTTVAVHGIMILADTNFKLDFMMRHAPINSKIDYVNISPSLLLIQQALCGHACFSRPPLPLSSVKPYITGDYVQYCLPMFGHYLANLPTPACIEFVKYLIDNPVSIQKHGLRLAFECFDTEILKNIILNIWNTTKNISLRAIIYKSLFNKCHSGIEDTNNEILNQVLITFSENLNDTDEESFLLIENCKNPNKYYGYLLAAVWKSVEKLPQKPAYCDVTTRIVKCINNNVYIFPEKELYEIINNQIALMLDDKKIFDINYNNEYATIIDAKWVLAARYLSVVPGAEQLVKKLEIVKHIIKKCIDMWSEDREGKYIVREFCASFMKMLDTFSYAYDVESFSNVIVIFSSILDDLKALPEREVYLLTWELRFSISIRNIAIKYLTGNSESGDGTAESMIKALLELANEFAMQMNEYINEGKYYDSLYKQYKKILDGQILNLKHCLDRNSDLRVDLTDMYIVTCTALLRCHGNEVQMYMFIIKTLPVSYNDAYVSQYKKILATIKAFDNNELQQVLYENFVNLGGYSNSIDNLQD